MKRKCIGCGAFLQTDNPKEYGYVSKEVLKTREQVYCQRCFRLKHYNQSVDIETKLEYDYQEIINNRGLIVNIIDVFNFEETIIADINHLFKSDNLLIVFNKIDLFEKIINFEKMKLYLQNYLQRLQIKYRDLMMISSFNKSDITLLLDTLEKLRNHHNVYFVGATNVGKSSIINQIITRFTKKDNLITVSNTANTTLGNIYIPYEDGSYLVDTPGINLENSLYYFITRETLKEIMPKTSLKPKTYQLNPRQSLFIAGFVRIDFLEGERTSFVTYFKNELVIHRTKLENASSFYEKHHQDILKFPSLKEKELLGSEKKYQFSFTKEAKIDIVIKGLGFVSISGEGTINISTFSNINIIKRKALI